MNNILFSQILQSLQNLDCKTSYQTQSDTLEIVVFDKIIKIDREQLEWDNQMFAEHYIVLDPNNVVRIIRVILL